MESEHTAKTLQIALGSYDRKELRVEKNYLQEQSPALECTCFQNGGRLLEQLRQGRQFDVVILCSHIPGLLKRFTITLSLRPASLINS